MIGNDNHTESSPVRSVIIGVINKIGPPRGASPICLITSMITDETELDDTKFCYQLIITLTKLRKFAIYKAFFNENEWYFEIVLSNFTSR